MYTWTAKQLLCRDFNALFCDTKCIWLHKVGPYRPRRVHQSKVAPTSSGKQVSGAHLLPQNVLLQRKAQQEQNHPSAVTVKNVTRNRVMESHQSNHGKPPPRADVQDQPSPQLNMLPHTLTLEKIFIPRRLDWPSSDREGTSSGVRGPLLCQTTGC